MADHTAIEWADATFNPWIGCTKVSPACDHCYAAVSTPARTLGIEWGAGQPRRRTAASNWKHPLRWERDHAAFFAQHGRRRRVFCASLADVFDNEVPDAWRVDLFRLIASTPNLDWLLLTKRIGNVEKMLAASGGWRWSDSAGMGEPRPNVWLGITVANQAEADRDIPKLLQVPAAVRWLSCEPLLGPVNVEKWLDAWTCSDCGHHGCESDTGPCECADCGVATVYAPEIGSDRCPNCGKDNGTSDDVGGTCPICGSVRGWSRDCGFKFESDETLINWVVAGGESGPGARPMHPDWARSLRDQCAAAGVPFLFKQWGEWAPYDRSRVDGSMLESTNSSDEPMQRFGKKLSGRLLDGIEHNGYPEPRP